MTSTVKRKSMALVMALLMCFSMFVSFGTTAQAAGERSEIYMVSFPRDAEANKNSWDRDNLQFMNGWYMEAYDMFATFAVGSYEGKVAYCIEPGTPIDNGHTFTARDETFWDNYLSSLNKTIDADTIKSLIGRILQYGYGYLKADVKTLVDSIVDELEKDSRIATLYNPWYEQRENVLRTYNNSLPERVPLSQSKEFKTIKNAVIQAAMNLVLDNTQGQIVVESDTDNQHKYSSSVSGSSIGMNALRLLQQTSQIIQNEVWPVYQERRVDRKLRRKINEKKQAQGLRQ